MFVAQLIVWGVTAYLVCGLLFGLAFVTVGVGRIDPHARGGSWGFRVAILPGVALLWPLMASRWFFGKHQPVERNAHRVAAGEGRAR